MQLTILERIHLILIMVFLSITIWPVSLLKYGIYVPILLVTTWLIFDGCPITNIETTKTTFTKKLITNYIPEKYITNSRINYMIAFILLLVTYISFYRLYN